MSFNVTIDTSAQAPHGPTTTKRHPSSGISVLIVGAGPVGVYTALECWRKGHNVRIVERNPAASTQGDSFTVAPQIINHITKFWPDMAEENERISEEPWISYYRFNGERVTEPAAFDFGTKNEEGVAVPEAKMRRHFRPKFLKMLISQLQRLGIEIEYGFRAVDYYETEDGQHAGAIFADGSKIEADVVVAADGIGTKSYKAITGHEVRAWSSGWATFRATVPVDCITSDAEVNERFGVLDNGHPVIQMWRSKECTMVVYRTKDVVTWGLMHKDKGLAEENWHKSVEPEQVLEIIAQSPEANELPDYAKRLIRAAPSGAIVDWSLLWRNPQPVTTSPRTGRIVQAGDAAHTFLPSSGSGVNQGIEDSIYLASCLQLAAADGAKADVKMATKVYSKLRFERVSCCQKLGLLNHERRVNIKLAADASKVKIEYGRWIWKHDPEQYVYDNYTQALDHLQHGTPFQNTNIPPGYVHKPWSVDQIMADIEEGKPVELEGDWS
ncbi:hypothetical protein SLS62_008766 [Diatrype stigma]|uniref:FAD-binding domain-containing protein n=1 Tax=Diatrype stigma TaxID=117547 RepID=A0AAN9UHS1_9PEZI